MNYLTSPFIVLCTVGIAVADWNCPQCSCIVHGSTPSDCPNCGFVPGAGGPPISPIPNPVRPFPLDLGLTLVTQAGSVVVQGVQPNSPSWGKINEGERIVKMAYRDLSGNAYRFEISSIEKIRQIKEAAGANAKLAMRVLDRNGNKRDFSMVLTPPTPQEPDGVGFVTGTDATALLDGIDAGGPVIP